MAKESKWQVLTESQDLPTHGILRTSLEDYVANRGVGTFNEWQSLFYTFGRREPVGHGMYGEEKPEGETRSQRQDRVKVMYDQGRKSNERWPLTLPKSTNWYGRLQKALDLVATIPRSAQPLHNFWAAVLPPSAVL